MVQGRQPGFSVKTYFVYNISPTLQNPCRSKTSDQIAIGLESLHYLKISCAFRLTRAIYGTRTRYMYQRFLVEIEMPRHVWASHPEEVHRYLPQSVRVPARIANHGCVSPYRTKYPLLPLSPPLHFLPTKPEVPTGKPVRPSASVPQRPSITYSVRLVSTHAPNHLTT
jgi:hypothetical protein